MTDKPTLDNEPANDVAGDPLKLAEEHTRQAAKLRQQALADQREQFAAYIEELAGRVRSGFQLAVVVVGLNQGSRTPDEVILAAEGMEYMLLGALGATKAKIELGVLRQQEFAAKAQAEEQRAKAAEASRRNPLLPEGAI